MGAEHTLGATREHAGQSGLERLGRFTQIAREHEHQRLGEVATREVIHPAVALGLPDDGHDRGGGYLATVDGSGQCADIARVSHGETSNLGTHENPPCRGRH